MRECERRRKKIIFINKMKEVNQMRGTKVLKPRGRYNIVKTTYAGKTTYTVVGARSKDFKTLKGANKYIETKE